MITHSITYTVDNATDFANNIGSVILDTHTKKYRDSTATHFSAVSAFNSAVDAGHINAVKINCKGANVLTREMLSAPIILLIKVKIRSFSIRLLMIQSCIPAPKETPYFVT